MYFLSELVAVSTRTMSCAKHGMSAKSASPAAPASVRMGSTDQRWFGWGAGWSHGGGGCECGTARTSFARMRAKRLTAALQNVALGRVHERGTGGWDLGDPAPAFKQLAASGRFAPGSMIVLGAGRGHDAREFARHGFPVTAVDFTAYAVREMQRLADLAAPIEIVQHDIFTLSSTFDGRFEYVLEHTCFCRDDDTGRPGRRSGRTVRSDRQSTQSRAGVAGGNPVPTT